MALYAAFRKIPDLNVKSYMIKLVHKYLSRPLFLSPNNILAFSNNKKSFYTGGDEENTTRNAYLMEHVTGSTAALQEEVARAHLAGHLHVGMSAFNAR